MGVNHSRKKQQKKIAKISAAANARRSLSTADNAALKKLDAEKPTLTNDQVALLIDTWKIIKDDMSQVGMTMFMKLFESHPDVQQVFVPFRSQNLEDMRYSEELKAHAVRVMGAVEKIMEKINDFSRVEEMLHNLGARHVTYSAKVDYIDLVGPQFIYAIQPILGDSWTSEVEQAWSDLFKYVSYTMKEAMIL